MDTGCWVVVPVVLSQQVIDQVLLVLWQIFHSQTAILCPTWSASLQPLLCFMFNRYKPWPQALQSLSQLQPVQQEKYFHTPPALEPRLQERVSSTNLGWTYEFWVASRQEGECPCWRAGHYIMLWLSLPLHTMTKALVHKASVWCPTTYTFFYLHFIIVLKEMAGESRAAKVKEQSRWNYRREECDQR